MTILKFILRIVLSIHNFLYISYRKFVQKAVIAYERDYSFSFPSGRAGEQHTAPCIRRIMAMSANTQAPRFPQFQIH